MEDRRRSARRSIALAVWIKDARGGERTHTADVSTHGIWVFSDHPRPPRQYVELEISLPESDVVIAVTAMVARSATVVDPATGRQRRGMGLDFFLFDARSKSRWQSFLRHHTFDEPPTESERDAVNSTADGEVPAFLIRPRDVDRLWSFFRGELERAQVRIETAVVKPPGTVVELMVVHPQSQAEWILDGEILTVRPAIERSPAVIEIGLPGIDPALKEAFRSFIATGRGQIQEEVSLSTELPAEQAFEEANEASAERIESVVIEFEELETVGQHEGHRPALSLVDSGVAALEEIHEDEEPTMSSADVSTPPSARMPMVHGDEASGPEASGPEASGPDAAGPEASGPDAAGPDAAYASGPEAAYVAGPDAAYASGPEAAYVADPDASDPDASDPDASTSVFASFFAEAAEAAAAERAKMALPVTRVSQARDPARRPAPRLPSFRPPPRTSEGPSAVRAYEGAPRPDPLTGPGGVRPTILRSERTFYAGQPQSVERLPKGDERLPGGLTPPPLPREDEPVALPASDSPWPVGSALVVGSKRGSAEDRKGPPPLAGRGRPPLAVPNALPSRRSVPPPLPPRDVEPRMTDDERAAMLHEPVLVSRADGLVAPGADRRPALAGADTLMPTSDEDEGGLVVFRKDGRPLSSFGKRPVRPEDTNDAARAVAAVAAKGAPARPDSAYPPWPPPPPSRTGANAASLPAASNPLAGGASPSSPAIRAPSNAPVASSAPNPPIVMGSPVKVDRRRFEPTMGIRIRPVHAIADPAEPATSAKKTSPGPRTIGFTATALRRAVFRDAKEKPGAAHRNMSTMDAESSLDREIALARARVVRRPNDVEASIALSQLLSDRGGNRMLDEAIDVVRKASALAPEDPVCHHRLAELFARKGDYRLAREHLGQAKRLGHEVDPDLDRLVTEGIAAG